MKKLLFPLLLIFLSFEMNAQQLFFEVSSGYNLTAYEGSTYSSAAGYVPIRARLAGGFEHIQLGAEYSTDLTTPEFNLTDPASGVLLGRQEFENSYYGLFLRGNLSSLPAYRFGVVLSAGAGFYNTEPRQFNLLEEVTNKEDFLNIDQAIGYNFRIGISSPIYTNLHWEIGYQFNYVDYDKDVNGILLDQAFQPYYHSFQAGLSLNLVFGNVEKKCRRVISGNRSKKGW